MEKSDFTKSAREDLQKLVQQNFDKPVKAIIPQENLHTIHIKVAGASTDISRLEVFRRCTPRTTVDQKRPNFLPFPGQLLDSFDKVNRQVVDWLAKSDENAKHFLLDPVTALTKAGINLQRTDQKQLYRNVETIKEANLLSPGTELGKMSFSFNKGKIKDVACAEKVKPKDNNCNC